MTSNSSNPFDLAMQRYQAGEKAENLIEEFQKIVASSPNQSAGWTCLAWLQLLSNQFDDALYSARIAVKNNPQDPQARINLSLALLETNSKGVREHIDFVKRASIILPEIQKELSDSIEDGLSRKPDWKKLEKIKSWLDF